MKSAMVCKLFPFALSLAACLGCTAGGNSVPRVDQSTKQLGDDQGDGDSFGNVGDGDTQGGDGDFADAGVVPETVMASPNKDFYRDTDRILIDVTARPNPAENFKTLSVYLKDLKKPGVLQKLHTGSELSFQTTLTRLAPGEYYVQTMVDHVDNVGPFNDAGWYFQVVKTPFSSLLFNQPATGGTILRAFNLTADKVSVARVDFYKGGVLYQSVTKPPFIAVVASGAGFNASAVMTDTNGHKATAQTLSVPPTIDLCTKNCNNL